MSYGMKKSGERIWQLRVTGGYTQNELAEAMNINQGSLSRIETGDKGCSVGMFVQFSEFFHVSLDALILGIDSDKLQECEQDMNLKADIGMPCWFSR